MYATAESIFGEAAKFEDVTLRTGQVVRVGEMTGADRDRLEAVWTDKAQKHRARAMLVVATARTEEGGPMFGAKDIDRVSGLPAGLIEPIVEAALRVNGFTAKDVEALEGNSETGPSGSSGSN